MNKDYTKYTGHEIKSIPFRNDKERDEFFSKVYDMFSPGLFTFARYMLYNKSDAEDVLQETFIAFYHNLKNKNEIRNLKSYLFGVIRRMCLKKNRDGKIFSQLDENTGNIYKTEHSHNEELFEMIIKTLPLLDEKYREAYILREIQGMDYDEISAVLEISQSGVRSRVSRAITMLKDLLRPIINEIEKFN